MYTHVQALVLTWGVRFLELELQGCEPLDVGAWSNSGLQEEQYLLSSIYWPISPASPVLIDSDLELLILLDYHAPQLFANFFLLVLPHPSSSGKITLIYMLFAEWGGTYLHICNSSMWRQIQEDYRKFQFSLVYKASSQLMRLSENKMFDYLLYPVVWSIWFTVLGLVQWVQTWVGSRDSWDTHLRRT